mgnify:FL=1|tara:strand:+ start:1752 stop:2135 length:384 start_codon:yes stop_codon:yes gene_type:complete
MFNNKEKELNAAGYTIAGGQVLDASGGPVAGEAAYGDVWYADEHVEAIMAGEVMPILTTTTAGSVSNQAMVTVTEEIPIEEIKAKLVRARNAKGQLVGDDPSTPDINEAWTTKIKKKVTSKKKAKKD